MSSILIIDDDKSLCRTLQIQLEADGHDVFPVYSIHEGVSFVSHSKPDIILLDVNLPDGSGVQKLPDLLGMGKDLCIVIMTGEPDNKTVIEAMRKGAFDYLRKPLDLDELLTMVDKVSSRKKKELSSRPQQDNEIHPSPDDMIGSHPKIIDLLKQIGLLSRSKVTVLIRGESGTGKELTARILHEATSPGMPFVAINCSAVVATLLESELFGYEKGAFTGADKNKMGKMEFAGEGTVFLDEIGDMPLDLQTKLLRVLQEGEFVRVGGLETIPLKARIIAATHCDLEEMVEEKTFRQDLFYRLNVTSLNIPPLRDRIQDIPLLVESLVSKICTRLKCNNVTIDKTALGKMIGHDWPGNVRELENILTRSIALCRDNLLLAEDIHWQQTEDRLRETARTTETLADAEKRHIEKALLENDWNITHTAQKLAISPTTLRKKINDFNLQQ